jgi:hypothetical protein
MQVPVENWGEAQKAVLERLAQVRQHVASRDEGAVMALINQQDAFCDEARRHRASVTPSSDEPQCSFCECSVRSDGCLGRLAAIDEAVLRGRWEDAAALVDEYIAWVKGLSAVGTSPPGSRRS